MKRHHGWCNGQNPIMHPDGWDTDENVDNCTWCSGEKGLLKHYPQNNMTEDELLAKHFPQVRKLLDKDSSQ